MGSFDRLPLETQLHILGKYQNLKENPSLPQLYSFVSSLPCRLRDDIADELADLYIELVRIEGKDTLLVVPEGLLDT